MASAESINPINLEAAAGERVRRLLAGRLRRGGIATSRLDWYCHWEPEAPQAYPGGFQVRVRTWRHWSSAHVEFDAQTGELIHRCVDRLADPATADELSQQDAVAAVAAVEPIPADARLASFRHESFAPGHNVARLEWNHVHDGLRVEGDCLRVLVHPQSRRLVSLTRRWRAVNQPAG